MTDNGLENGAWCVTATPAGAALIVARGGALVRLALFPDRRAAEAAGARLGPSFRCAPRVAPLAEATRQLAAYFARRLDRFELPLDPPGTAFQKRVWSALAAIPRGETRSYGALARAIGRPGAARAVGAACGANRIAIVIPCHRALGARGELTGYAGGLGVKRWLLEFEGVVPASLRF